MHLCTLSQTALMLHAFNIQNYSVNNLCKNIPVVQPFQWVFAILGLVVGQLFPCDNYHFLHV